MKKLFLSGACLLALSLNPVRSYASDPELVVVRLYDSGVKVHYVLTGANGRNETGEFISGTSEKSLAGGGQGYYNAFYKLYQEGYVLQSTIPVQYSPGSSLTTLLFVKAPKP